MKTVIVVILHSLALLYLYFCTRSDLRSLSIHPYPALAVTAAGIMISLLAGIYPPAEILLVLGGGALLFLVSFISHSSIGYGDCFVIIACGALTGFASELSALFISLIFCAAFSAVILIRRKATRKDTLPFVPFLLAGHAALFLFYVMEGLLA